LNISISEQQNELDDRAESKKKNRQLIASEIARINLRNSDKQFTYDTQPPVGLSKKQKQGA